MRGSKLGHILLLGALTILPGCLAINAALGVLGAIGPPAAQLAGTAYTVAEYSYEYGAHGRTPDEVFLAKFDWLANDGDEPDPAAFAGALSVAVADAGDMTGPVAGPVAEPAAESTAVAEEGQPVRAVRKASSAKTKRKIAPVQRTAGLRVIAAEVAAGPTFSEPVRIVAARRSAPVHTYVPHAPDPLLARLNRLENGLAQAETLYLSQSADGLRLSVPPRDGDPCAQGVNGGSSLRLPVMRTAPASPAPPA
ncbi:hypothetical protein BerOc1_01655 [Pseudodesulfovibrio hydrargyri]|uniref:Uncharacterized protein n=1 Tax=Pseudodesulfovibrio hydrargyri TaxID=2125990 RepID=A0A1J5MUR2_9BACT|nr:hypothetical protein [Pseudodesulfovibrio hydrargyri]OIQ49730.1 hypothetical protein BerOc1_01655 [Pseudodesulfovibrio hydrargyri]